jgi:hypothetical protein
MVKRLHFTRELTLKANNRRTVSGFSQSGEHLCLWTKENNTLWNSPSHPETVFSCGSKHSMTVLARLKGVKTRGFAGEAWGENSSSYNFRILLLLYCLFCFVLSCFLFLIVVRPSSKFVETQAREQMNTHMPYV